jgi:hypothetical protein
MFEVLFLFEKNTDDGCCELVRLLCRIVKAEETTVVVEIETYCRQRRDKVGIFIRYDEIYSLI